MKNQKTKQVQNRSNSPGKKQSKTHQSPPADKGLIFLLPIMFIVSIFPLIVKLHVYSTHFSQFPWHSENDLFVDFFLYYKQIFLILTAVIMGIILLYQRMTDKNSIAFPKIFIPLGIYGLLALLSSLLTKYRSFSFTGTLEQFESVWALLSYCLLAYYSYLFVKSERDLKFVLYALLAGAFVMGLLGMTQAFGKDFYSTDIGWSMISNSLYADTKATFPVKTVYLSLLNPNYVGVYVSLLFPITLYILLFSKRLWLKPACLLIIAGLMISLYGSRSTAGFAGVAVTILVTVLLLWRYLIRYFYLTIPVILAIVLGLFTINNYTNNYIGSQIKKLTNIEKYAPLLTDIQTNDDNLVIQYGGNTLKVVFEVDEYGICNFFFQDQTDSPVAATVETVNGPVTVTDERFPGFVFTPASNRDGVVGFDANINQQLWFFTNQRGDNTYYYVNAYGKYDKIVLAPSAVFTGYERYASGRGYIWSRTIPLLKNRILLGSGADTFALVFPHNDYVHYRANGYEGQVMSKPHSLYLQIGVQTGAVSLLAFLAFCGWYILSSAKLYFRCKLSQPGAAAGAAIFVAVIGYLFSGISNDSTITVAPVFWVLIGIGIAMNQKIKSDMENSKKALN